MTAPVETVTAYFDLSALGGDYFTLDDPTKGVLDGAYTLGGVLASDITGYVRSVSIRRGRDRRLNEVTAGVATVVLNNQTRVFDPLYVSSPYYGNIRPGKKITFATNGIVYFDGLIDDINYDYPVNGDSTVTFQVVDCLAQLGSKELDAFTASAGQLPGARISAILDRPEVGFPATRNLDAGSSTLQADVVTAGTNALNYVQLVNKSDLGIVFASAAGVLTFYGRNRIVTGVGAPVFVDDATALHYMTINLDYGTELLFNRVSVSRAGGGTWTVTDDTSVDLYGVRALTLSGLLMDSDTQSNDMANYLLGLYALPDVRISQLDVFLNDQTDADQASVLGIDIGSVVRVKYTPNRIGAQIDQFCMVEGMTHDYRPPFHTIGLEVSNLLDGFTGQPLVLDSTEFGLLDMNVLAF